MLAAIILVLLGVAVPAHAAGQHWTGLGPDGGSVDVVASDPTNGLVIYAGALGGIRKSTDGGATWTDASTGLQRRPGVWTISIDPSNPSHLLAGGIFMRAGVHRSVDGGATWVEADFGLPDTGKIDVFEIARDPSSPQTVYLTAGAGIFKSTTDGVAWAPVAGGGLTCPGCAGAMALDGGVLYIDAGYTDGVRKSTDGGATFTAVGSGLPASSAVFSLAARGGTILVGFYQNGVYRSTDAGASFAPSNTGLPSNPVIYALADDPAAPSNVYAVVQSLDVPYAPTVYRSTDAGASWAVTVLPAVVSSYDPHALTVDGSGCVIVGSGGTGVWRSCTGGASWTNGTSGFRSIRVYDLVTDPGVSGTAYLGADRGVFKTTNAGATWTLTSYPDPYVNVLALAPSNTQVVYAIGGPGARSADGGVSWTACAPPGLAPPVIPYAIAVDPSDPNTVYVGYYGNGFLKSTDGCATWTPINNGIMAGADGRGIAIDPTNPQTIYGATAFGGLVKSTDGGASWTKIGVGAVMSPYLVAVAPSSPTTLYVASDGVRRSLDGGATWTAVNNGLPDDAFNLEGTRLIVDPTNPLRVMLAGSTEFGADGGVWLSPSGGDHWNDISRDLHDYDVSTMALDQDGETLFAGTEGSGAHRIDTRCNADPECLDTNECTVDTCNPLDPASDGFGCVHFQADPSCVDQCNSAAECQGSDLCEIWTCAPGDPDADARGCVFSDVVSCTAPDVCHNSSCDSDTGQCVVTPNTGNVCDDGEPCTYLDRCQAGVCKGSEEPVSSCKTSVVSRASVLTIRNGSPDTKDKLTLTLRKMPLANAADFGNPFNVGGTGYLACFYDHSGAGGGSRLRAGATIPAGGTCGTRDCWTPKGVGLRYRNRTGLGDGGIDTLELIPGPAAKLTLKAHGAAMETPAGPLAPGVTLQIRRSDTSTGCWGAAFGGFVKKNDALGFKARSD